MKILYYDCFSGISGDMNLAAMIDLGLDKNFLLSELKKLKLSGYTIRFNKEQRSGITGTRVDVITDPSENQIHRNLSDIEKIIDTSDLNKQVKSLSKRIFQKLGKAEAHVHNKPISKIHFHEVGAIDSIIDIIGAAICHDYFQFDKIFASKEQHLYYMLLTHHPISASDHTFYFQFGRTKIYFCSRCSGMVIGIILSVFFTHLYQLIVNPQFSSELALMVIIICPIPGLIDWGTQKLLLRTSTTESRLFTGFIIGIALHFISFTREYYFFTLVIITVYFGIFFLFFYFYYFYFTLFLSLFIKLFFISVTNFMNYF